LFSFISGTLKTAVIPAPAYVRTGYGAGITAKVKKPMFEKQLPKPKNGFPPARE
jgi:hypothetical protein